MRILVLLAAVYFASFSWIQAASIRITATVTVTNAPIGNTNTLTVNASTRTFTNQVTASPSTLIQETNSRPWTATNILNHLTDYKVSPAHVLFQSTSTNVSIRGAVDEALTVSLAGGWGGVTYTTQTVQSPTFMVRAPLTVEAATNRTTIASYLVRDLSDYSTEAFDTNSTAVSNLVQKGAGPEQYVAAPIQFNGTARIAKEVMGTNGFLSGVTNINPVSSNAVNYGNAIRSEGYGGNSFQAGSNAVALGVRSIAIGNGSIATNTDAVAMGTSARATNDNSTAVGNAAQAVGDNSTAFGKSAYASGDDAAAIGNGATASADSATSIGTGAAGTAYASTAIGNVAEATAINAIAIGQASLAGHSNSVALGSGSATTTTNQIRLGTASETVSIPGAVEVAGIIYPSSITNHITTGTNVINARIDATPRANTALANGYNSAVVFGSNYMVRFSGPTAAYTNAGFAAPGGPQVVIGHFDNPGLSFTLLDESGLDGTAANRIITGTGALVNSTNRVAVLHAYYDMTASRWRIISFR